MQNILYRVLAILIVYLLLRYMGGSFGTIALYPVTLFVTFLHEFGHALAALLTGGSVNGMKINPDGSGYTVTQGGAPGIILMGGYIGSAVLGNLLFYIAVKKKSWTQNTLTTLSVLMFVAGVVWFESIVSTGLLFAFALTLWFIAKRTDWDRDVLMFLGIASILYILNDFNVGPSSDLQAYEQKVGFFPAQVWMYIWLAIVALLGFWNIRRIFKNLPAA